MLFDSYNDADWTQERSDRKEGYGVCFLFGRGRHKFEEQ